MQQEFIDCNTFQILEELDSVLHRAIQCDSLHDYKELLRYVQARIRTPRNRYHELVHIHANKLIEKKVGA